MTCGRCEVDMEEVEVSLYECPECGNRIDDLIGR